MMSALLDSATERPASQPSSPTLTPELARKLLIVAFRPAVVTFTLVAAIIVVTLVAANSDLTGVAGAVAASWLAVHQVQITIGSTAIGVLPMLPTALLVWGVGRTCMKVVEPAAARRELLAVLAAAMLGPVLVAVACLAVIADASSVLPISPPYTPSALGWVALINGLGAFGGIVAKLWRARIVSADMPSWVIGAGLASVRAAQRLLVGAAVVACLSLVASWPIGAEVYAKADGFSGIVGLTVLSIAYLPNVLVGTAAVVVGASAGFGEASVSLFGVIGGPVPGVPILAVVPSGEPRGWWLALLAIPAYVAVRLGRECAAAAADRTAAAKSAAFAALVVGTAVTVASFMSGGSLGTFGYVGADGAMFGIMAGGWLLLLGATTALLVPAGNATSPEVVEEDSPVASGAPTAIDAEIVDEQGALELESAAAFDDPDAPLDAEVVDLPVSGDDPAV